MTRARDLSNGESRFVNTTGDTVVGTLSATTLDSTNLTLNTQTIKRSVSGVASVTFSAGVGTLSFGTTLPFTPAAVCVLPSLGITPVFIGANGSPTTTGISLKCWTATVAAGSTVALYTGSLSTTFWIAYE